MYDIRGLNSNQILKKAVPHTDLFSNKTTLNSFRMLEIPKPNRISINDSIKFVPN